MTEYIDPANALLCDEDSLPQDELENRLALAHDGCLLTVVLECMMPAGEVLLVEQFIKEAVHMDVSIFHIVQQKQFMKI